MILKGSQRAGAKQLAVHLLKTEENEHVQVHDLRGFSSDNLKSALQEAYAISRGTQAKQFLFSLSLNPPRDERVSIDAFEAAIEKVERKLGLEGQPRAIVFHEKDGRRHAHVVWSRIDADEMKAINLPHFKLKLGDISRELYLEHGWEMPKGFKNSQDRDRDNFSHEQWQQAKRAGHDPKTLKAMFRECWIISDSKQAFSNALEERGFVLAQGDRRGYVAVDLDGEIYAIAKYAGARTAEVKQRLGDAKQLPTIEQVKLTIAKRWSEVEHKQETELKARQQAQIVSLIQRRQQIVEKQRVERTQLDQSQVLRRDKETLERSQRLSKGMRGLWDRVTGKHAAIKQRNEVETLQAFHCDRAEKDDLIFKQLEQRKLLHKQILETRRTQIKEFQAYRRHLARNGERAPERSGLWDRFREVNSRNRTDDRSPDKRNKYDLER